MGHVLEGADQGVSRLWPMGVGNARNGRASRPGAANYAAPVKSVRLQGARKKTGYARLRGSCVVVAGP